jgi:hypothetical protein
MKYSSLHGMIFGRVCAVTESADERKHLRARPSHCDTKEIFGDTVILWLDFLNACAFAYFKNSRRLFTLQSICVVTF